MNAAQLEDIKSILLILAVDPKGWYPNVVQERLLYDDSYLNARKNILHSVTQKTDQTIRDLATLKELHRKYGDSVSVDWIAFDLRVRACNAQLSVVSTHPMVED